MARYDTTERLYDCTCGAKIAKRELIPTKDVTDGGKCPKCHTEWFTFTSIGLVNVKRWLNQIPE